MPNTFKNYTKDGSAVAASTNMDVYTVPSTTATVIGLTVQTSRHRRCTVDVKLITSSGDDTFILKAAPVPVVQARAYRRRPEAGQDNATSGRVVSSAANSADSKRSGDQLMPYVG